MTYRIQFSGLSESRVRTACGGMVGGDARVLNVWGRSPMRQGSYNVRSRARTGVGKPDTFEVTWTSAKGRTSVLTTHKTFEQATARLVYMRAPLGSPERDEAYRRFLAVGGAR